jgi:hypothetical protein
MLAQDTIDKNKSIKAAKSKGKKKAIDYSDDSEEDYEEVKKPATKRAAPKPKVKVPLPGSEDEDKKVESPVVVKAKAVAKPKVKVPLPDSDEEMKEVKPKPKPAAKVIKRVMEEVDSDEAPVVKKAKTAAKPVVKKVVAVRSRFLSASLEASTDNRHDVV